MTAAENCWGMERSSGAPRCRSSSFPVLGQKRFFTSASFFQALPACSPKWGGLTERLLVASASSYVVSPEALGPAGADPGQTKDRLSATYLIALAARAVREVGRLLRGAEAAGQKLATLSIDTEIRFRSPGDRAAFTHELTEAVTSLVSRYHDAAAADGRPHRLVVLAYPMLQVEEKP